MHAKVPSASRNDNITIKIINTFNFLRFLHVPFAGSENEFPAPTLFMSIYEGIFEVYKFCILHICSVPNGY